METLRSADGTRIAFDRRGSGPALLLVGGAFSDRSWQGDVAVAEALADTVTTVVWDRRGRGDSGDEARTYAPEREIEDLAALADAVGGRPAVFGNSSGGALALRAAAAGVPMTCLAVYEAPYVPLGRPDAPPSDHRERLRELVGAGRPEDAARYFLRRVMGVPAPFLALMRLTSGWRRAVALAPSLPYDAEVMGDFSLPADFARITVPTLVLGGAKSPGKLRAAVTAVADAVPGARSELLPKQNHGIDAVVLAGALRRFLLEPVRAGE
jgi:pimeloyl-ACP methyl ester carboxylesterase